MGARFAFANVSGVRWDRTAITLSPRRPDQSHHGRTGPRRFPCLHFHRTRLFDASINRIAAWVIGTRNAIKALLVALLEPTSKLRQLETTETTHSDSHFWKKSKTLPFGAIWDEYCRRQNVPTGASGSGCQILRKLGSVQAVLRPTYETQGFRHVGDPRNGGRIMNADIPPFGLSWKPSLKRHGVLELLSIFSIHETRQLFGYAKLKTKNAGRRLPKRPSAKGGGRT